MKKFLCALMMWGSLTVVQAKNIELVLYYPPGGGGDQQATLLIEPLAYQGIRAKKVFFKTCTEALNYVKNNQDAYLVGFNSDLGKTHSGICPSLEQYPELTFYSTIADNTTMFCTSPNKSNITFESLTDPNRTTLVGLITGNINWHVFDLFLKNSQVPLNIKIIPFKGTSEIRLAAVSGNIDAFYIGGLAIQMHREGSQCLAASARTNWADAPFLGDFTTLSDFPETYLQSLIYSNGPIDAEIDAALQEVFKSDDFLNGLKNLSLNHSGLGIGRSSEIQKQELNRVDNFYQSFR